MIKQASNVWKHLRRFLTADPGRFAGGSAVSDPLGLPPGGIPLLIVLGIGADVILTGRNLDRLQHAAAELGAVRSSWPLA